MVFDLKKIDTKPPIEAIKKEEKETLEKEKTMATKETL